MQPYLSTGTGRSKADTALSVTMLEVSIQLVRNAWNQHQHGLMWDYWYSLPNGYQVPHWQDDRLTQAGTLMKALMNDPRLGTKGQNFLAEIYAYAQLVSGNTDEARNYYQRATADPVQTFPVSYQRAKHMLSLI